MGTNKTVTLSGLTLTGADAANYTLAASGQQAFTVADIVVNPIVVTPILDSFLGWTVYADQGRIRVERARSKLSLRCIEPTQVAELDPGSRADGADVSAIQCTPNGR